jgi:hypothetical protein
MSKNNMIFPKCQRYLVGKLDLLKMSKMSYTIYEGKNLNQWRKVMTTLLSSSEARRRLNMSTSTFKRLVDTGKIRKVTPPNKKQGLYIEEDVKRIEEDMRNFMDVYTLTSASDHIKFAQAQNESDIKASVQIGRQHFGDFTYDLETRMQWFRISPKGDYTLKHDGVVVGYFSMQAIKSEAIKRIFEQNDGLVQTEDMAFIESGKPLECYISAVAVTTAGVNRKQSKIYGMLLLMGISDKLVNLGEEGVDIRRIWAKSRTVSGIKLSRDLGFKELGYIDNEQIGFVLDMEKSDLPAIKRYREALEESKAATRIQ